MSTTRIMPGIANQEGRRVNTLVVGEMVSRLPLPRYRVTCERCGSETTESHERLNSGAAQCKAAGCGKAAPPRRDRLDEERREAAERESERIADERRIAELRMQAEVGDDYELPSRYAPKPTERREMSERERLSIREFKAAEESQQREADAPRLEAERRASIEVAERERREAERKERQRLHWADAILNSPDPQFAIDPATTIPIPSSQVASWHAAEMAKFKSNNPGFFPCAENETAIASYLDRNAPNLKLVSAVQLEQAVKRLSALGLLKERPAPEAKPAPAPKRTPEPAKPTGPAMHVGRDPVTGLERSYSERQVNRMSADEYRRCFPVTDSIAELFSVISEQRQ